ncbi:PA3371 family protein [Pseudomonas fluorescens]|uniref:Uncharacterized protein n=1 Tax=Pseudomonas fluorescens TaxID=294 RepID=A0A5E7DMP1_PSEFL|nr:PA3371 family protein [Pseudomonas fluorescens]VVO18879.1 hypothetical protein PS691_04027 [Pseudomonas fluorescens]
MSKPAAVFLILALLSAAMTLILTGKDASPLPMIAFGAFAGLFILALIAGRKIKFDPVLR